MKRVGIALAFGLALAASGAIADGHISLPKQLAWTAYGTGSAGYNQSVAIGAALQEAAGVNLRVLPGKNDVARTEPLRQGKVQFSATGVGGSFMAQEGVFVFGSENWGPQKVGWIQMAGLKMKAATMVVRRLKAQEKQAQLGSMAISFPSSVWAISEEKNCIPVRLEIRLTMSSS